MEINNQPLLQDQVCFITGSSRGIGRQIALALARQGAHIAINYLNHHRAAQETAEAIQALERDVQVMQGDISQPSVVDELIQGTYNHFNRLDLVVHNAGIFMLHSLEETSLDEWHSIMATNLHSAFYCVKSGLPLMKQQGQGHFIFIGSVKADSVRARHHACPYGISKTGLVLLAKSLAREEGRNGIRANVVNPGAIEGGWATEERRESLTREIALQRIGQPSDIAGAVVFLHSPQGAYCNGSVINVDGGLWL